MNVLIGLGLSVLLGIFSIICFKAGKKGFGFFFGIFGFLLFMTWLRSGPGFAVLDWGTDPSVKVPDNIPLPGGK